MFGDIFNDHALEVQQGMFSASNKNVLIKTSCDTQGSFLQKRII
jgi:hypothetical protein